MQYQVLHTENFVIANDSETWPQKTCLFIYFFQKHLFLSHMLFYLQNSGGRWSRSCVFVNPRKCIVELTELGCKIWNESIFYLLFNMSVLGCQLQPKSLCSHTIILYHIWSFTLYYLLLGFYAYQLSN